MCLWLEAIKRDEIWRWEDFSGLVAEGKCLFYVLAIHADNEHLDCFVFAPENTEKVFKRHGDACCKKMFSDCIWAKIKGQVYNLKIHQKFPFLSAATMKLFYD